MGMYSESKEIPAALLDQVLQHPGDPAWVDGLLFVEGSSGTVEWSKAASRSAIDDEELLRRFTCPYLDFSVDERRRLARYDLGKLFDWQTGAEFWHYVETVESSTTAARETWRTAIDTNTTAESPAWATGGA